MKLSILLISLFFFTITFAQENIERPEMRFGKGIEEAFELSNYTIVDDDEAVVLFDKGSYDFKVIGEKINFVEDYHVRMKILKQSGLERANIKLLAHESVDIKKISASSYNFKNGKVVEEKLKNRDVFFTKRDDEYSEISFAIPNVKVGSIIEFEYSRHREQSVTAPIWYFDRNIPVVYSEISFNIPEWFQYSTYAKIYKPIAYKESKGSQLNLGARYNDAPSTYHVWGVENLEPFEDESFVPNIQDFRYQIDFRLNSISWPNQPVEIRNTSWEKLNKNLLNEHYDAQFKDKKIIEDLVEELTANLTSPEEKMKALFDYVSENIEIEKQGWVYPSKPVKAVLKDKKGIIADANLLLVNMLQSAGIDAKPLLISTRDDGYVDPNYASLQTITYPVVYVNIEEKQIIMNAVSEYRPYYLPRSKDYNLSGWVVDEYKYGWVEIESLAPLSKRFYQTSLNLTPNGKLTGNVKVTSSEYLSLSDRINIDEDGIENRFKVLFDTDEETNSSIEISNEEISDIKNGYDNFKFSADFEVENAAQVVNDFIYFNPMIFDRDTENPFKKETRNYPVDYIYPYHKIHRIDVEIPEGYELEDLPQPVLIRLGEFTEFKYIPSITADGKLQLSVEEKVKQTVYYPEEYAALKQFTQAIIDNVNKQFVLKKIN